MWEFLRPRSLLLAGTWRIESTSFVQSRSRRAQGIENRLAHKSTVCCGSVAKHHEDLVLKVNGAPVDDIIREPPYVNASPRKWLTNCVVHWWGRLHSHRGRRLEAWLVLGPSLATTHFFSPSLSTHNPQCTNPDAGSLGKFPQRHEKVRTRTTGWPHGELPSSYQIGWDDSSLFKSNQLSLSQRARSIRYRASSPLFLFWKTYSI
jgi:hypothetical protein